MESLRIGDIEVRLPIVQGGMGVAVSLSGLAAAVANEGGIGVISAAGIGMDEPDYIKNFYEANKRALRKEIKKARSLSNGIIGLNVMLALSDHENLILTAIEEKIDVIFMGAGLPLNIPAIIERAGLKDHHTKLIPKVSSAKAARLIFQYWANKYKFVPDAVALEGPLAGGHLGFSKAELSNISKPLNVLVEETVKEIRVFEELFNKEIPVIAGGGIYSGKDMYDIMQAGAKGVKLGTRFVTTFECDASQAFKESYLTSKESDIVIIDSPVGLPGRVVKNDFVEQILRGETKPFKCPWKCLTSCDFKKAPYCIAQVLFNSAKGNMAEGFAFAGAKAYKATKIIHVSEVIEELVSEYNIEFLEKQLNPLIISASQASASQVAFVK
jgi:NAD(P)H-dependent flavin oxidoreductase YrpB (nitropropane dioxygenase family)